MTDIVAKVCKFTEQLLAYEHDLILRGRDNFERVDFSKNYIVIDDLVSTVVSSVEQFKGDQSIYSKVLNMRSIITLNFYGSNALSNAQRWATIKGLQAGREIQSELRIDILQTGSIRNLKALTGKQYNDRYEVECTCWYNIEEEVEINSITDLEFNIINNK